MNFELSKVLVTAHLIYDQTDNLYTIYSSERGGPIITAQSEEEAKKDFEVAINIAFAIRNLLYFKGANMAQSHSEKMGFINGMKNQVGRIEYIQEVA
jgi:hypothetical protein